MIQQSREPGLFDLVKWLIPAGSLLFAGIALLWSKYFRFRPKVRLSVTWGGATSSPREDGGFLFRYSPRLVLHNDSNFVARRITVVHSSGTDHWRLPGEPPTRIEPDAKHVWEFAIDSIATSQDLINLFGKTIAATGPSQAYFPYALGEVKFIISYDNEKDTTFYTAFTLSKGQSKSKFHRLRPRL